MLIKSKRMIPVLLVLILLGSLYLKFDINSNVVTYSLLPESIVNNFGSDPITTRNFTWYTSAGASNERLEFCVKKDFVAFSNGNVSKTVARIIQEPAKKTVYKVELTGLLPGTEYVYRVGSIQNGFSENAYFQTEEANSSQFTFLNITDTQGVKKSHYKLWKNTLDKALEKFPQSRFLIHTGDMVDNGDSNKQWDWLLNGVSNELMNLPIEPVVGNHDASNYNNFTARFNLPISDNTGTYPGTVYSFDYGDARFAIMNTEGSESDLRKQGEWLSKDMSASNKKWKIVALHRGPYGASHNSSDIRNIWVPYFDTLGIDLVLQGHDHNYVRSYPMLHGSASSKGTVYVVGNSGGVKFYPPKSQPWQQVDSQPYKQMFVAVTVDSIKLSIQAFDVDNNIVDYFELSK